MFSLLILKPYLGLTVVGHAKYNKIVIARIDLLGSDVSFYEDFLGSILD